MMQKDEATLLLPWVRYHGRLFGFANLFVFDNGSTDPTTLAALDEAAGLGVSVDRSFATKLDFVRKGDVLGERMRMMRDEGGWDVLFPLDCDEFLALRDGDGVSFDRERMLGHLARVRDDDRIPYVLTAYLNVLGTLDRFRPEGCLKTFIQARGFQELDHGFHQIRSSLSETPVDSGLVYIHCHAKPFAQLVRDAREKLRFWCDVDDPAAADALEAANGAGWHLVKYLRMTEREYLAGFQQEGTVALPGFAQVLAAAGADTGFLLGEASIPRQGNNGVMVFGPQGEALDRLMRALCAAGVDVAPAAELYLHRHWRNAFASGEPGRIRRELLILAAQPAAWASWFPDPALLTPDFTEALRWPRAIQLLTTEPAADCSRLTALGLPVLPLRWPAACAEPDGLARTILAHLALDPAPHRIEAMAACLADRSTAGAALEGWIDSITETEVAGWCWRRGSAERQTVTLLIDGTPVATTPADQFRGDLLEAGVGDGHHGFRFAIPGEVPRGDFEIEVAAAGTEWRLSRL
jgi:hypothetical protein